MYATSNSGIACSIFIGNKMYGEHLRSVVLYGTYARGDDTADSDVDIMLLVDRILGISEQEWM